MKTGHWQRPSDVGALSAMTEAERPEDFTFYSLGGIIRETDGIVRAWEQGYGHICGLIPTLVELCV